MLRVTALLEVISDFAVNLRTPLQTSKNAWNCFKQYIAWLVLIVNENWKNNEFSRTIYHTEKAFKDKNRDSKLVLNESSRTRTGTRTNIPCGNSTHFNTFDVHNMSERHIVQCARKPQFYTIYSRTSNFQKPTKCGILWDPMLIRYGANFFCIQSIGERPTSYIWRIELR